MWNLLCRALFEGNTNAAIADQVAGTLVSYIKDQIKLSEKSTDPSVKELNSIIIAQFKKGNQVQEDFRAALKKYLNEQNFIIYSLTLNSSQRVRNEAKEIIA